MLFKNFLNNYSTSYTDINHSETDITLVDNNTAP